MSIGHNYNGQLNALLEHPLKERAKTNIRN